MTDRNGTPVRVGARVRFTTDLQRERWTSLKRAAEKGYPWSVLPGEAAALVAEVERLSAEVAYLRACVPPTRPADYGHEAWTEAVRAENAATEARIVAWLRRKHLDTREHDESDNAVSLTLAVTADRIERGEHRRRGEK